VCLKVQISKSEVLVLSVAGMCVIAHSGGVVIMEVYVQQEDSSSGSIATSKGDNYWNLIQTTTEDSL
jgi:hypothetical protein